MYRVGAVHEAAGAVHEAAGAVRAQGYRPEEATQADPRGQARALLPGG